MGNVNVFLTLNFSLFFFQHKRAYLKKNPPTIIFFINIVNNIFNKKCLNSQKFFTKMLFSLCPFFFFSNEVTLSLEKKKKKES